MIKISVVIRDYDRQDFLKDAVDSVLNQTLDKSLYEIIIVKNFESMQDNFWRSKGIKIFFVDGTINGELLKTGIEKSEGEIIAFLDDDDLFESTKLEKMLYAFDKYGISYYHNNQKFVNKELNEISPSPFINDKYKNYKIYDLSKANDCYTLIFSSESFNMSSIAVKKELLLKDLDLIEKITYNTDGFAAYIAAMNKVKAYGTKEKLTTYRIHDNNISIFGSNLQKRDMVWNRYVYSLNIFKELSKRYDNYCWNFIYARFIRYKAGNDIYYFNNINLKEYFLNYSLIYMKYSKSFDIFFIPVLLSKINKIYTKKLIEKISYKPRLI